MVSRMHPPAQFHRGSGFGRNKLNDLSVLYRDDQHVAYTGQRVLSRWDNSKPADYAVGDAWGGSVIYPCYSLVDHADGEPVERHPDSAPRTERRRAWRLA